MSTHPDSTLTSTLQLLLNDWPTIREIFDQIATTLKTKKAMSDDDEQMTLVSGQQFTDATQGPFHPILNELLHAYAQLRKIKLSLILQQDESLKDHVQGLSSVELPPDIDPKAFTIASIDKALKSLSSLAKKQLEAWQQFAEDAANQLVMELTLSEINLSEIEIERFSQLETLSELFAQFTDLHLTAPPIKGAYRLPDYFQLKIIVCLHSALSRQHQPHTMADIEKQMKPLKKTLKQLRSEESAFLKTQADALEALSD